MVVTSVRNIQKNDFDRLEWKLLGGNDWEWRFNGLYQ